MVKCVVYFCVFCKIGNWIKETWNSIVDALKEVVDFLAELAEKILNFIFDKILGPIIEKLIEPILRPVFNLFAEVLKEIVSNVVMPLLEDFLKLIIKPLVEFCFQIINAVYATIRYFMLVGMLKFVDLMETGFDIFSGVKDVTYRGSNDFLLNVFFKNNVVNTVFWGITLLAVAMVFVFAIIAILKSMTDPEVKRPVGKILGAAVKAVFIMCIIPFVCLFVVNLSSVVLRKTDDVISLSQNGNKPSLGTLAFLTYTIDAALDEEYNVNPRMTDELRADYLTGKKTYWQNGISDFDIIKINYFMYMPVTAVMIFIIFLCTLVFIMKIFEVLVLYIASPFFVATMVLDDGQKFNEWCEMFVAKLLSGFGMVIIMKLFFIISPVVMTSDVQFSSYEFVNTFMKITFLIGGLWAVYKSGNLITQIININAAYAEAGLTSEVVNKAVGAAMKYGTMAVKAVATEGSSLTTDLTGLAAGAAKSGAQAVTNPAAESSGGKKDGQGQAFTGDGKKEGSKPPNRSDSKSDTGASKKPNDGSKPSDTGSKPSDTGSKPSGGDTGNKPSNGGNRGGIKKSTSGSGSSVGDKLSGGKTPGKK